MSCNGCRVLRKGCGVNCVLRPCLESIQSPDAQGHATLFLSKFFGRSDLVNFISAVPSNQQRAALFQSLLYEAVGRTVNPVNGAMGLLSTGNWHLCEAGVQTVLAGGSPAPLGDETWIHDVDESSEVFQDKGAWAMMMNQNQTDPSSSNATRQENVTKSCDEPKLLDLFK
ncbi:lateral organ boundaries domain-containing protein [Artemisia annua]|uniref:Lateral organ boundaries domain-containing protein n=1 Tax=Artemisia annua TaxID=35608 RepID=A0A2U1LMS2_ARTAN|nr:lateral organ boundaries domain-containing protein [Artemisia annua]